ncbi:DUF2628 domain-containing protein [Ancylobacter sp. MQZ15Z-1]|uniref:DUF2628 domain-containing protein n=1 Tax=Ancylobacter mangrovi TaxID=2972472 RepID=A0A9X2PBY8_9HYPH|nr:DUF2628 domain-containing protein [Ancylobacter mangrovi]MCS0495115.1 DUF2628 domain-containing protein [Ancylobacter mangrovi]
MAIWTVFEPDEAEATTERWAQKVAFVREGFSWSALFFAPLVLLAHRLWLGLLAYLAIQGALLGTVYLLDVDSDALVLLALTHLAVALMLPDLRRGKLLLWGYEETGAVAARRLEEAEQRYFEARLNAVPAPRETPAAAPLPARPAAADVLGLFPEAGR